MSPLWCRHSWTSNGPFLDYPDCERLVASGEEEYAKEAGAHRISLSDDDVTGDMGVEVMDDDGKTIFMPTCDQIYSRSYYPTMVGSETAKWYPLAFANIVYKVLLHSC
jgi:hypothetical protein